ncbi:efflux RND transporter periplasmic adaptor subunit [candidate division CSSED10-310 bacterium]|uniref:Efflux RND transporter periplasmic adaptor subunit n=1 Tax=candidate division CSSED10-310 bacterium TaxID=2855610 RepID=A0ABV6YWT0_UNCC1
MKNQKLSRDKMKFSRPILLFLNLVFVMILVGVVNIQWIIPVSEISQGHVLVDDGHGNVFAEEETLYTCGMHPQVIQDGPGICPICNMDLTPMKKKAGLQKSGSSSKEKKIKYWAAPMDPTYISDKPGKSPMGMDLVPVYEDGEPESDGNAIIIDPVVVQNMGVRVEQVKRGVISKNIRTIGDVEVAEDELSVVNLRFSGWLEKVFVEETGQYVRKGEKLFEIYSPELLTVQNELIQAISNSKGGVKGRHAQSSKRRLELFGIPDETINKIIKKNKATETITITAPQAGHVLHKNVVEGSYVKAGSDLYRIGNLDRIWILAEVYEHDVPWLKLGQKATIELSQQPGKLFEGTVSFIYPTLNKKTRTATVRIEISNKDLLLKPGMFATVRIEAQKKEDIVIVPTEAVIRTGERNVAFVTAELGKYKPREVVIGLAGDNRMLEIISGLKEGETVVVSGQFLFDSESQLQEAIQKLLEARLQKSQKTQHKDHDQKTPGDDKKDEDTYWTCSMHPTIVQDKPGNCPICGMDLVQKKK